MFLRLTHATRYEYSQPVAFTPHAFYLRPRENPRQRLHEFRLTISPECRCVATTDPLDNALDWAYFTSVQLSSRLEIRSELMVETLDSNPFDYFLKPAAVTYPFSYDAAETEALAPALVLPPEPDSSQLRGWLAAHLPQRSGDTVALLTALNQAVHRQLRYVRREEPGIQTGAQTLALGGGSCRDYAVFFIELSRLLGLAARFVSGYVYEPPLPGMVPVPPDMHAWAEVYLPGGGWRGLDPTRGIFCDDAYVPVAHTAVAASVNPVQGTFIGPPGTFSTLHTSVSIVRL